MMMRLTCLFLCFLLFSLSGFAQQKNIFKSTLFGLQLKPIFGSSLIGNSTTELKNAVFSGGFEQKTGNSYGAILRIPLTPSISIETGLNQTTRNYAVHFQRSDTLISSTTSLRFLNYEVPVNALYFVKLTKNSFLNTAFGAVIVYSPSNVASVSNEHKTMVFKTEGRRISYFSLEINGGLGIEWRTLTSGHIYLGSSVRIPTQAIYNVALVSESSIYKKEVLLGKLNGSYITLDLRYYLPSQSRKEKLESYGPIE